MVTPRTKVSLIDCSAHKRFIDDFLNSHFLSFKHVIQRITVLFEPKLVCSFDFCLVDTKSSYGVILRGVDYNRRIILSLNWSCSLSQFSDEPIVPAFESIVRFSFIANKIVIVKVFRCFLTQPSSLSSMKVFE